MTKAIATFLAAPTEANAKRVAAYARKHPMAVCLLSDAELRAYEQANAIVAWADVA